MLLWKSMIWIFWTDWTQIVFKRTTVPAFGLWLLHPVLRGQHKAVPRAGVQLLHWALLFVTQCCTQFYRALRCSLGYIFPRKRKKKTTHSNHTHKQAHLPGSRWEIRWKEEEGGNVGCNLCSHIIRNFHLPKWGEGQPTLIIFKTAHQPRIQLKTVTILSSVVSCALLRNDEGDFCKEMLVMLSGLYHITKLSVLTLDGY